MSHSDDWDRALELIRARGEDPTEVIARAAANMFAWRHVEPSWSDVEPCDEVTPPWDGVRFTNDEAP